MYQKHDNFTRVGVVIANVLLIVLAFAVYANQNATIVVGTDNITTVSVTSTSYLATTINYTTTSLITTTETATYTPSPLLLSQTGVKLPTWQEPWVSFNFKIESAYTHVWFTYTIYNSTTRPAPIIVRYAVGDINEDIRGEGRIDLAGRLTLGTDFEFKIKSHESDTFIDFEIRGE